MNRSIKDKLKVSQLLAAQTVSATGNSTGVDNADFNSLMFIVDVGTFAFDSSNYLDVIVQDSDVDVDGSYAAVGSDDVFETMETPASGIFKVLDSTDDDAQLYTINYRGNKRYARIRLAETGTVSAPISVVAVQGHSELMPPL